jgi:hypothetical protein
MPTFVAVVMAIVAAILGIFGQVAFARYSNTVARRGAATALLSEISAILEIVRQNDYETKFREIRYFVEHGFDVKLQDFVGSGDFDATYRHYITNRQLHVIGLDLSSRVDLFYRRVNGIKTDIDNLSKQLDGIRSAQTVEQIDRILLAWPQIDSYGRDICSDLRKIAQPSSLFLSMASRLNEGKSGRTL